ncbi:response regulator [Caenimonas koreensis DSM 17982]|uniref:Response regulator n=1 Tax=Caenimonas koreensis DSM 17982 TaxID=1121255 RepID=A0A844BBU5_9BURK|nr:response regulator transcription factor [Caenimonas koreensis]MRD48917.1 response regulator [Caenimonas koreensis DSM 17982]
MAALDGRRFAIVEDDPAQRDLLQHIAKSLGATSEAFGSGEALLKALQRDTFDLLMVDWNLPGIQGPDIVSTVRAQLGLDFPIILITSRALESEVVTGLKAGADDYVTKPVRPMELAARIQAALRRAYPEPRTERREFGLYTFDMVNRVALLRGEAVDLQPREFDLAVFMFANTGRLLSRAHLLESGLHANPDTLSRSLDTHISRLRVKLAVGPANGFKLASVYGMGYRLDEVHE